MKQIKNGKIYDTEQSDQIAQYENKLSKQKLYRTDDSDFFIVNQSCGSDGSELIPKNELELIQWLDYRDIGLDEVEFNFTELVDDLWLTERQAEFWMLHSENTLSECAEIMDIAYSTAENHRDNIYRKRMRAKNTIAWMDWIQNQADEDSDDELEEFDPDPSGGDDACDDV